jgi:hypothetical protein
MSSRRNFFIRSIAAFTGDFSLGFALASTCIWMIQSAALGLFLTFLLWLMVIIGGLAMSQLLVHPTVQFALSDRKLDRGLAVAADAWRTGTDAAQRLWADLRSAMPA